MIVVWLFLTMQWDFLQFVIVVFSDHTHVLLWILLIVTQQFFTSFFELPYCVLRSKICNHHAGKKEMDILFVLYCRRDAWVMLCPSIQKNLS